MLDNVCHCKLREYSRDISQERYIAQSLFARIKCFLAKNANRQQIPPKTIIQYDGCVTQLNKDLTRVKSHSESRVTERLLRPGKKMRTEACAREASRNDLIANQIRLNQIIIML